MIRWFSLLPFSVGFTLLAYVLAPVAVLFARPKFGWVNNGSRRSEEPRLHWWLKWLGTSDNSLLGDDGHKERHKEDSQWWQMTRWTQRNCGYGFDGGPLAAKIAPMSSVEVTGNPQIKNRANAIAGSYFCRVGPYFNYKLIKPLFGDAALMLEFGWKLQGFAQGREVEGKAMYVCSVRLTAFNP